MRALFTIIIPHKDVPELLDRCLCSIPHREDIQTIVVDDGSNDVEVVKTIEQSFPWVLFIYEKNSCGPGVARNRGLEKANGEWIVFADADDYFVDSFWEHAEELADMSADIVYTRCRDEKLETERPYHRADYYNTMIDAFQQKKWRSEERLMLSHDVPWSKMIRHSLIQANHIRFYPMMVGEDTVFSVSMASHHPRIAVTDVVMYVITSRAGSLSTLTSLEILREHYISSLMIHQICPSVFTDSFMNPLMKFWKLNMKDLLWMLKEMYIYHANPFGAIWRAVGYKIGKICNS